MKRFAWAIGICDQHEIDRINILNASILAMHKALRQLTISPQHIIVDGNRFKPFGKIPYTCFVKGDGRFYVNRCCLSAGQKPVGMITC